MNIVEACEALGLRLKSARLAKNLTQRELAKMIGISRGKIVEAEKGHATMETLFSILFALKKENDLDALLPDVIEPQFVVVKKPIKPRVRASGNKTHLKSENLENKR